MTPPIALVIFDCDGVPVDSEPPAMRVLFRHDPRAGLELAPATGYDLFLGCSLSSVGTMLAEDFGVSDDTALPRCASASTPPSGAELKPMPGIARPAALLVPVPSVAPRASRSGIELSLRLTGLWPWFEGRPSARPW